MTAFLSAFRRTAPKQLAALAALPVLATSLLSAPALAANPTATPASIEISPDLYAQVSGLSGTWRATDASVLQQLDALYSPSGAAPERITGSVYMTFSPDGTLTIAYDNLTMYMPESEDIPPITLRGNLDFTYVESAPGVLSFTGESHSIEAEVMGFVMPGPEVPAGTSATSYDLSGEVLTFGGFDFPALFPGSWLRSY